MGWKRTIHGLATEAYFPEGKMRLLLASILGLCASISLSANAQDTRDAELAYANDQLNVTYQALLRQLTPKNQSALRAAQRAWIRFRDVDCSFGWADRRECLMQRTDEREKQFREAIYFDAGGKLIELPAPPNND